VAVWTLEHGPYGPCSETAASDRGYSIAPRIITNAVLRSHLIAWAHERVFE
jgi:hypothetical protein